MTEPERAAISNERLVTFAGLLRQSDSLPAACIAIGPFGDLLLLGCEEFSTRELLSFLEGAADAARADPSLILEREAG